MSTAMVEIPDSLYERLREVSLRDEVSVGRFVATAVAEKLSVVESDGYIRQRAQRADPQKFAEALAQIRDVEPEERDRL